MMVYYNPHITGTIPYMGVSKNNGTPKSSILIGFSIINHPLWVPLFLETPIWLVVKMLVPEFGPITPFTLGPAF